MARELGKTRAQAMALSNPVCCTLFSEVNHTKTACTSENLGLDSSIKAVEDGYFLLTDPAFLRKRQQADEPDSISARVRREHPIKYKQLDQVRIPIQDVSPRFEAYMEFSRRIMEDYEILPKPSDSDDKVQARFQHKQREMALMIAVLADNMTVSNTIDAKLELSEHGRQLVDARRHVNILFSYILWYYDDLIDGTAEDIQRLLGQAGIQEFIQDVNKLTEMGARAAACGADFPEANIQAFQKKYTAVFAQIEDSKLIVINRERLAELAKMARTLVRLLWQKIDLQKNTLHFSQAALALGIEGLQAHFDFRLEEVSGLFTDAKAYRWKRDGSAACDVFIDEDAMVQAACRDFLANAEKFNAAETPILDRLLTLYDRNQEASLPTYWLLDKARMAASKIVGLFNDIGSNGHEILDNNAVWIDIKQSIFREGKHFASLMDFYAEVLSRFTSQQGYAIVNGILEEVYEHFLDLQAACETLKALHPDDPAVQSFIAIARMWGGAPFFDWTLDATRYMGSGGPALLVGLLDAPEDWETTAQSVVEQVIQPQIFPPTVQKAYRQIPYSTYQAFKVRSP
ncbi:MAG: hypothetical protein F6J95_019985 [Leptolyngbya sp. SIO1E4]|nr:hypothetical protein [Leptolyngbya sp. SIO1E4]